jgi:hypothetical protein
VFRSAATGATTSSAAGAYSASAASATAAALTHALRSRQTDAGEQHCCGQQELALSRITHLNLLRCFAAFFRPGTFERQCSKPTSARSSFRTSGKKAVGAIRSVWRRGVTEAAVRFRHQSDRVAKWRSSMQVDSAGASLGSQVSQGPALDAEP